MSHQKHRVFDIMTTLREVQPPRYSGEIQKVYIKKQRVWYEDSTTPRYGDESPEQLIKLEAMQFADENGKRLEWVIQFFQ